MVIKRTSKGPLCKTPKKCNGDPQKPSMKKLKKSSRENLKRPSAKDPQRSQKIFKGKPKKNLCRKPHKVICERFQKVQYRRSSMKTTKDFYGRHTHFICRRPLRSSVEVTKRFSMEDLKSSKVFL